MTVTMWRKDKQQLRLVGVFPIIHRFLYIPVKIFFKLLNHWPREVNRLLSDPLVGGKQFEHLIVEDEVCRFKESCFFLHGRLLLARW